MQRKKTENTRKNRSILHALLMYFLISELIIIAGAYVVIRELSVDLPGIEDLERIPDEQPLSTIIYSDDGVILRTFQYEKRFWVKYDEIPQCMIDAVTSAEDSRFFKHWGVSLPDILRAIKVNVLHMGIKEGASTITQQLARVLFLDRKTTYRRKLKEMIVAMKIEHTYSKSEILEFFLNGMDFSNNSFGIQAAAQGYFGKNASEINLSEAALLAGILQSPPKYNPRSTRLESREQQLNISKRRRNTVLWMMANNEEIPWWKAEEEMAKPIELSETGVSDYGKAPYFVYYVKGILENNPDYGEKFVNTSGARVITTLDYRLQEIAEKALKNQLDYIQKTYGNRVHYTRPEGLTDDEAVQDSLKKTVIQGALVAVDVETGQILAMVGGKDYSRYQFNRATQAMRQAGSSFKPFLYTAALDNGWRCCDTIYDGYWSITNYDGTVWEPRNFKEEYLGIMSLRDGFKLSQNMIAVKLMNDTENRGIGAPTVKKYARKMGISTYIPAVPSIAVGTPEVKLIEMVSAYTVFPNLGMKTETLSIKRIYDKNNTLIFNQEEGTREEVLKPEVASLMITMLKSVTTEGTGSNVIRAKGMSDRICAGKTGTGQDYKDAWFIGFTPHIACGVWIGFDSEETTLHGSLTETGATAALPVWVDFISEASEILGYPKDDDFTLSRGITTRRLCKDSYRLVTNYCPEARIYTEYFINGTEIKEFCDFHGPGKRSPSNYRFRTNATEQKARRGP